MSFFPPYDPGDVDIDKDIDVNVSFDFSSNVDIYLDKYVDIDIYLDSHVNIDGNFAQANFDVEAIGDNSSAELDLVVLTTDNLSSITGSATSAVD
jgi:hypothetical protein